MKSFSSKYNKSYVFTTYLLSLLLLGASPLLLRSNDVSEQILGVTTLVIFAMIMCMLYPFRYIFDTSHLRVKMGLVYVSKIPYDSIERVTFAEKGMAPIPAWRPTNSGLKLTLKERAAFISPADEQAVFLELKDRCPHLRQYGNELRNN